MTTLRKIDSRIGTDIKVNASTANVDADASNATTATTTATASVEGTAVRGGDATNGGNSNKGLSDFLVWGEESFNRVSIYALSSWLCIYAYLSKELACGKCVLIL